MRNLVVSGAFVLLLSSLVDFTNASEVNEAADIALTKPVEKETTDDPFSASSSSLKLQDPMNPIHERAHQAKVPVILSLFKTIKVDVQYKGGTAYLRSLRAEDIEQNVVETLHAYDPSDPNDTSNPDDPLPTIEEVREDLFPDADPDSSARHALYGIFDHQNDQVMGLFALLRGHLPDTIESTIRIHQKFRGIGLATAAIKGMFEASRRIANSNPGLVRLIETTISDENYASIKAHTNAGMIKLQNCPSHYYYPLNQNLKSSGLEKSS